MPDRKIVEGHGEPEHVQQQGCSVEEIEHLWASGAEGWRREELEWNAHCRVRFSLHRADSQQPARVNGQAAFPGLRLGRCLPETD